MDDQAIAQRGLALGVVAYIVLIGLLLPSAVITSIATYRFSKSTKQGTPAYTSGCSPASLFVAQLLGWPAFFTFSIVAFIAISVCSTVATRIKSQFDGLPGIVAAMVSVALLLLGRRPYRRQMLFSFTAAGLIPPLMIIHSALSSHW
jgi:hypothetical protein